MDDFTCPSVRYLTLSVFWVSLLGIPKSLVIWVRGYPKHGDTQITVTPALLVTSLHGVTLWTKNVLVTSLVCFCVGLRSCLAAVNFFREN